MSAPVINAVLPPAGAAAPPSLAQPLSLSLPAVKQTPPSPPASSIKPQTNHVGPAAISLGQDIKAKTPEKPKDLNPPKPTPNGTEESPVVKHPTPVGTEAETSQPVAPSIAPIAPPTVLSVAPPEPATLTLATNATTPAPAIPAPASVPTPVAAPAPPTINEAAEPPSEADAPSTSPPKPEPDEAAAPSEQSKPKAAKPQAAKRRRATPPASSAPVLDEGTPEKKPRRMRAPVNPYQSPLPEITTVINRSVRDSTAKPNDEKLIVFYKNEFLAVRNAEGGFYLCQSMQNIFRTSHKIRIRWLSRDDNESTEADGIYTRDFYDSTDFECILTTVALQKKDSNKYKMPATELERVESILKRALDVEKGVSEKPDVTEEHPDGLDLSLYRDESQLQKAKQAVKRKPRPPRKSSSPKRAKKAKQKKSPSVVKKVDKTVAPAKVKTPTRKALARKPAPPTPSSPEKKSPRLERSLAREKASKSVVVKASSSNASIKSSKPDRNQKKEKVEKSKKPSKPEKVVEVKTEKKVDKKKAKAPVAPAASTSKKTDKGKKPAIAASEKRTVSTRNKGRK